MNRLFMSATTLLIIVLAGVACGGGGNPKGSGSQASGTPGKSSERGDAEFGLTGEEVARRVDAVESLVATCMTDAGFEYIPVDYATARAAMDGNSKASGLTNDEFRDRFGYGITTLFAGADSQTILGAGEENIRIRENLAAADRIAYMHVLYGENPSATFVVGLDEENFSNAGGCTATAVQQVFSTGELGVGFVNYQNEQAARIDQDSRVIAAYVDWADCMRKAGYNYNATSEIETDLASRLDTVTAGQAPDALPPDAQKALTELQGEELAIAVADHSCELNFVDAIKKQVETDLFGPNANN